MKRKIAIALLILFSLPIICFSIETYPGEQELRLVEAYLQGDESVTKEDALAALDAVRDLIEPSLRVLEANPLTTAHYVLNTSRHTFHYPDCNSVNAMKESNRQDYYGSRDDLLLEGYHPCGVCNP